MWLLGRPGSGVHLLTEPSEPVQEPDQQAAPGPHRRFHRRTQDRVREAGRPPNAETSANVRERIDAARELQRRRFDGTYMITNSEMGPVEVWEHCKLDDSAQGLMQAAIKQMNLSARGFHRIQKVARTTADVSGADNIEVAHLAEALQCRPTAWA